MPTPRFSESHRALLQALDHARPWLRRDNVVGLAIGCRHKAGEYRSTRCLVVTVDRKVAPEALAGERLRAFPETIEVWDGEERVRVRVDVQVTTDTLGRLRAFPAGALFEGQVHRGTVGLVVEGHGKRWLVTAGHVGGQWEKLSIHGREAVVDRYLWDSRSDQALLRVQNAGALPGALPGGRRLGANLAAIGPGLVNRRCLLFRAGATVVTSTIVRNIDATVPFAARRPPANEHGVLRMRGLVAIDSCTAAGDSGTLLFDPNYRPIGTLVGTLGNKDYFSPCHRAFAYWNVRPTDD